MSTIAIDFDGVLSDYTGWKGGNILDPPVSGAIQAIRDYQDAGFDICIYTTRADGVSGISRITRWLQDYGLEFKRLKKVQITNLKPPAIVYLDDRAWPFKGDFPSPDEIRNFKTWQGH